MSQFSGWFGMKSAKQRARDAERYERWAFPYGQPHRQKVEAVIKELLPEEDSKIAMMLFLQGKQAYTGEDPLEGEGPRECSDEMKIAYAIRAMEETLRGRKRVWIARYLALIIADQQADETLQYPANEQLLALAATLEKYL